MAEDLTGDAAHQVEHFTVPFGGGQAGQSAGENRTVRLPGPGSDAGGGADQAAQQGVHRLVLVA